MAQDLSLESFANDGVVQGSRIARDSQEIAASRSMNRIILRGREFRFDINGNEEVCPTRELDVIILNLSDAVGRLYYGHKYVQGGDNQPPTCWSNDGKFPAGNVAQPQGVACDTCPMNVQGSALGDDGSKRRACGYMMRAIVLVPALPAENNVFRLDIKAMSLFGNGDDVNRQYSFLAYINMLATMQVPDYHMVLTRLSFSDDSVPALRFHPAQRNADDWVQYSADLIGKNAGYGKMLQVSGGNTTDGTVQPQTAGVIEHQATQTAIAGPVAAAAPVAAPVQSISEQAQSHAPATPAAAPAAAQAPAPAQTPVAAAPVPAAPVAVAPVAAAPAPAAAAPVAAAPVVAAPVAAAPPSAPVAAAPMAAAPTSIPPAPPVAAAPVAAAPVAVAQDTGPALTSAADVDALLQDVKAALA